MKRRGMFYVEENGEITSTQYSLLIAKSTSVWITVSPSPTQSTALLDTPLDMAIFLIRSKADKNGNSLVAFTETRDSTGVSGTSLREPA